MHLVFFGSGSFGLPTLERLVAEHDVDLVVTQPDRPAGRRRALTPTPVADFADGRGIPCLKPERVNDPETVDAIRRAGAGVFVVVAFGQKIGPALLEGVFAINLHGSLLPKYRGAAPINWAVINGETETGVSVIVVGPRMDAGAVLASRPTPVDPAETAGELHDRLALMGPECIIETLRRHERGALEPVEQDEALATRAPKLSRADGTVGFDQPAAKVRSRVHGLTPWPGCSVTLGGGPVKILRVEAVDGGGLGVAELGPDGAIGCRPGAVRLLEVQPPGGRPMSFEAYRRGHAVAAGAKVGPT